MSAIKDIKKGIIINISAIDSLNKVYDFEKINPDGFPAAFVTFNGTENEFYTTAENKRIYVYRILVLAQIGQTLEGATSDQVDTAEQVMQDCVGDILDTMDSDITLDNNSEVIFVEAAVGQPGYVDYEGGVARSGEILIKIHSLYLV